MKLRLSLAGALLLTPALGLLSAAPAGAAESSVDADFACTSVTVSSTRHDLSNVVLRFADGDQKFDGLKGKSATFSGTGEFAGDEIEAVFVKAGSNASGAGPGYGEQLDAPAGSCGTTAAASTDGDGDDDGDDAETGAVKGTDAQAPASGGSEGGDAVVGADVACDGTSVDVTSTKDLSNVVLVLSDGTHVKHEGLSGHEATFLAPSGTTIVAVYVKSGANHSGDGPGYGEKVDAEACDAEQTPEVIVPVPLVPTSDVVVTAADVVTTEVAGLVIEAPAAEMAAASTDVAEAPAAPAAEGAVVLGVSLERSAPAASVIAAGLARTGLDFTALVLVALSLLVGGVVLTRRGAAKRTA